MIDQQAELRKMVQEEIKAALAAVQRCTAEAPHDGKLRFQRGVNVYVCECGQRYKKGLGTLISA